MGDYLRQEISNKTKLGNKIKQFLDQGALVPDQLIFEVISNFLKKNIEENILFDGFPRTLNQAKELDQNLRALNKELKIAIELHLNEEQLVQRLVNRLYCPQCGAVYNTLSSPPLNDNLCDTCKIPLLKRDDDQPPVIRKRFKVYEQQTRPLVDYYKKQAIYRSVDASGKQDEVFKKISEIINEYYTEGSRGN